MTWPAPAADQVRGDDRDPRLAAGPGRLALARKSPGLKTAQIWPDE
ncbi:MAG: hypothetical protein LBR11_07090 [Deltaproteobacteria bacterium]|nr:hypothetical protein [Deltaproteobacteria bacterium]